MSLPVFPSLLAEDEPAPFEVHNRAGASPLLIVVDHAGRRVPRSLRDLGLSADAFERHIAWDIGARDIALRLAERFDARTICSVYSRLVVDLNRYVWDPSSMPETSDATRVPGNNGLDWPTRERRVAELHRPYHDRVGHELDAMIADDADPILLSIHTMTDRMQGGARREEEVAVCWVEEDQRLSAPLLERLRSSGEMVVGDNTPYALELPTDFTVPQHAMRRGLRSIQVEFRQDLVDSAAKAARWADCFADALKPLISRR